MSIRRSADRPNDHFTIVANDFARDDRLSFKALGIAVWLLSHSVGFTATTESIAKSRGVGLDLVRTGLRELEEYGYLHRERARDEGGQLAGTDWILTDRPDVDEPRIIQRREIQRRQTQRREIPTHKKNKGLEEQQHPEDTTPSSAAASATGNGQLDLDGIPTPTPPKAKTKTARKPTAEEPTRAHDVTRAWVDAYRETAGAEPTKRQIGTVARTAKEVLLAGNDVDRLITAARSAGCRGYTSIDRELAQLATTNGHRNGAARNGHRGYVDTRSEDDYSGELR